MTLRLAVLGAGAHGREVAAVASARWGRAVSVTLHDDSERGRPPVADVLTPWVAGAVWPEVRRQISAQVARGVEPYDRGRWAMTGAIVSASAELGAHVHLGAGAIVSHGSRLGEYATLAAGANLSGEVTVDADAFIGAGAVVIHGGILVGRGAFVAAGAVVVDDVPPGAVVAGNPARVIADAWSYRDMANGRRGRARD